MSTFAEEIEHIGKRFADQVTGAALSPLEFSACATDRLEDLLQVGWSVESLADTVRCALPKQDRVNPNFGEPAITLFVHDDFRLDALCWRPGATSIHHHDFSGAFGVLNGTSLHRTLRFTGARSSGSPAVEMLDGFSEDVAVLRKGDVQAIHEGPSLAHQVTHLEPGAVTVVLRSHGAIASAEEWSYLPPNLRVASRDRNAVVDQQARFYRFLRDLQPDRAIDFASAVIAGGDAYSALEVLRVVATRDRDFELTRRLALDGAVASALLESVVHEASRERVAAAMRKARNPAARVVFGVFSTAAGFGSRRQLLKALNAENVEALASRVVSEWLVRLGLDPAERDHFERDLAGYFATAVSGSANPPTTVARALDRFGLSPCILGHIAWPELRRDSCAR